MKYALICTAMLLALSACDRAPEAVDPNQMSLDNPGRTADNHWVVGADSLNPERAEADARIQVARKNCRLIALPGEPPLVPGAGSEDRKLILVGDAPADGKVPQTSRALAYGELYNAVVQSGCN